MSFHERRCLGDSGPNKGKWCVDADLSLKLGDKENFILVVLQKCHGIPVSSLPSCGLFVGATWYLLLLALPTITVRYRGII